MPDDRLFRSIVASSNEQKARLIDTDLDETLSLLLAVLETSSKSKPNSPSVDKTLRVMKRATDWIHTNCQSKIPITKLCEICHVSERTLERCFQKTYQCTPRAYILAARLDQVRNHLRESDPYEVTVSEVAEASGFPHASRFSQQYKSFFGEFPKQTLGYRSSAF